MGDVDGSSSAVGPLMQCILCFSGNIAAGKSTWSSRIADELNVKKGSFGDYLRKRLGTNDRDVLKTVGAKLVAESPDDFARSVLEDVGWRPGESMVLEGLRHISVLDALRVVTSPARVLLLFVDASAEDRLQRIRQRGDSSQLKTLDADPTESDVPGLRAIADIVINHDTKVEEILAKISQHGCN
jgi:dephospho-CoA kinase